MRQRVVALTLGLPGLTAAATVSLIWRTVAPLAVWTLLALARAAWAGRQQGTLALYLRLRPRMLAEAVGVLSAVGSVSLVLLVWGPTWLSVGWLDALAAGGVSLAAPGFSPAAGGEGSGGGGASIGSVLMAPLAYPWLVVPMLALLVYALPWLAWVEELVFRQGTRNWRHGIVRSFAFGLAHLPMGIPVGIALALSITGLWLTAHYFRGGPIRSASYHLAYNTLVLGLAAVLILLP